MRIAIVALVFVALLSGCMAVGRFIAPIGVGELNQAAQDMVHEAQASAVENVEDAKSDFEKTSAALRAEIVKLKNAKPATPFSWIFASGAALFLLLFVAAIVAGFIRVVSPMIAVGCAVAAVAGICLCGTFELYGRAIYLGGAITLGVVALSGLGYGIWKLKQSESAKAAVLSAVIPVIEAKEPKKDQDTPSGPLKAAIADFAKCAGTSDIVAAEVAREKSAQGI